MQVVVHQFDGVSTFQALPLAAGLLIASARRDPLLRSVADFQLRTARVDLEEAVPGTADVLAYSIYVWNERYTLEVARRAKERHPQALVVLGGPSVPRRPERAEAFLREHPFVDALVFGEGELVFRQLLRRLHDGAPLDDLGGIALRTGGLTGPRPRIADLSETGSPFLDGTFDALLESGLSAGAAGLGKKLGVPLPCTLWAGGQTPPPKGYQTPPARLPQEL